MTEPITEPAAGTTPPTGPAPTDPAAAMATDAGKKALEELRQQNKDLAKQLKALSDRDPLKAIAEALGVKPSTEPDAVAKLAAEVKELREGSAADRLKALRLEVAAEKGLTPAQAKRLTGTTRDELAADADELKTLFPAPTTGTQGAPGTPMADPTQGARGGGADLHAAIAAAQEKGDAMEVIRLQRPLLDAARAKQQ